MNTAIPRAPAQRLCPLLGGFLVALIVSTWPAAEARGAEPVAPKLTPKLQKLFAEEMVAVLQASQQIVAALVAGDHPLVARQAQAIHDSFILDKNLTAPDRKHLETALPHEFLGLDAAFHQLAAKLADAARHQDRDLQTYYFGRMLESCQACHSQYATDKFPAYSGKPPAAHGH